MFALVLFTALAVAAEGDPDPADAAYAEGLAAWRHGDVDLALRHALIATSYEPGHRAARLLIGYALLREHRDDAAVAVMTSLAAEPVDGFVQSRLHDRAVLVVKRVEEPRQHDQVWFDFGLVVASETRADGAHGRAGNAWELSVPLSGPFAVRFDAEHPFSTDARGVGGWRLAPMVSWTYTWGHAGYDVAVGPSLWLARGVWWPSGTHAYGGARVAFGADTRLGRRGELRAEFGLQPHVLDDTLYWYAAPWDVRFSTGVWFGHPRS